MTDEYALELFLDSDGEAACARVLDTLERAGLQTIRTQGHRPHLSLTVGRNLQRLDPRGLAVPGLPLSVTISAVGTFPGSEGVVYWAPTVTRDLLDLHARWFENLKRHSVWFDAEPAREVEHRNYYVPSVWVPHISLGLNIPSARIGEAVEIVRAAGAPTVRLASAALVHVPSGRETAL
jgi:hypothetical protein